MSYYVAQSGATAAYTICSVVQTSDGKMVWLTCDNNTGDTYVYVSTDNVSATQIAAYSTGIQGGNSTLCIDANDNLYLLSNEGSGFIVLNALPYTGGTTWGATQLCYLQVPGSSASYNSQLAMIATADGGGTGGNGHLLMFLTGTSNAYVIVDAGAVLAGTATSASITESSGSLFDNPVLGGMPGAANGIIAGTGRITAYEVSSAGRLTATLLMANSGGSRAPTNIIAYESGKYALTYGTFAQGIYIWLCTDTAIGNYTSWTTDLWASTTYGAFLDPTVSDQIWIMGLAAAPSGGSAQLVRYAWQLGSGTPTLVNTLVDDADLTNVVASTVPAISAAAQTRANPATWLAVVETAASPSAYAVDGGASYLSAPPNAPTLVSPGNGTYLDVSSGVTFSAVYNPNDNSTQNAYAMAIQVSGASSWSYFNAATNSLQSTIVWNTVVTAPGGTFSWTVPSTALSNGNTYIWTAASQSSNNNSQSVFASSYAFNAQAGFDVAVTTPAGTVTVNTPLVSWTCSLSTQTDYRIVVYPEAVYTASGFIPGQASGASWDSGTVISTVTSVYVPQASALISGLTYRAYVQLTVQGGQTSTWEYSSFTVDVDQPVTPAITVSPADDPYTGAPVIAINIQGLDNYLSSDDSTFETSLGTWTAGATSILTQSEGARDDGGHSAELQLTSGVTGNVSMQTASGTSGYPVIAGKTYVFMAAILPAHVVERSCTLTVIWYNSSGTQLSTTVIETANDVFSSWTVYSGTATVPTNGAFCALEVSATGLIGPIGSPSGLAINNIGTSGTTSYTYEVTATSDYGESLPSASATTTTGNAVLNNSNYNEVTWSVVPYKAGMPAIYNLVYDSTWTEAQATVGPTWGITGASWGGANGDFTVVNGTTLDAALTFYGTGTTVPSGTYVKSQIIDVTPGATYTVSAVVDATHVTSGTPVVEVTNPTFSSVYATVGQTAGTSGTISQTFVVPAGVTQVVVICNIGGVAATAGQAVTWQQVQLTESSVVETYAAGPLWTYTIYRGGLAIGTTTALGYSDQGAAASTQVPPTADYTGEGIYVDNCGFFPEGGGSSWSIGGFVGSQLVTVYFSTDGVSWIYPETSVYAGLPQTVSSQSVVLDSVTQQGVVEDWHAQPGILTYYQVQIVVNV